MVCNTLMAIRIKNRDANATKVQEVLTGHGCNISMRLGLHDPSEGNVCSPDGTLILQLCCTADEAKKVEADLVKIDGVKAKFIDLD